MDLKFRVAARVARPVHDVFEAVADPGKLSNYFTTGGAKGRRFALPHSKIMIHQPRGGVSGQVSDIEIQAEEILKSKRDINEILAFHTGQPIDRIARDTERDRYLTGIEAKDYGIVDEVVGRMPALEAAKGNG